MIADLKADSERWETESTRRAMRGQAPGDYTRDLVMDPPKPNNGLVSYEQTVIHDDRQRHGPSQPSAYPEGGQPRYMSQQDYAAHEYTQAQVPHYGQPTPGSRGGEYSEPAYAYHTGAAAYGQAQSGGYDYPSRDGYDPRDPRDMRDLRGDPRDPRTAGAGYESASLGGSRPTPPGYPTQQQYAGAAPVHGVHQSQLQGQHSYGEPSPPVRGYPTADPYGGRGEPRGYESRQPPRRR